jgi:holliday junction DNA helicase RuvB
MATRKVRSAHDAPSAAAPPGNGKAPPRARAETTSAAPAAAETRLLDSEESNEDTSFDRVFRPKRLKDFIGQPQHTSNLEVYVQAAKARGEPLDHVLLCGPPGLGKTTLAHILAREMGVNLHITSGPAIEHKGALTGQLTRLERGDILFIDEIHRLSATVEEALYPAIEDFRIDVVAGDGPFAESISVDVRPFTLIGATTRAGLLTKPLHERFGATLRLDFYGANDLELIVLRSARLMHIECSKAGARELANRSRGTPRVANRLLRRVRDFAEVMGRGVIDEDIVRHTCERLAVDAIGLDEMDRRLLRVLIEHYQGGPVGVETLAAALAEPRDTIEDVYEPYLLQQGYLGRTPRGRIATQRAYEHLGIPYTPGARQGELF